MTTVKPRCFLLPCLWVAILLTLWNLRGIWKKQENFIHTSKGGLGEGKWIEGPGRVAGWGYIKGSGDAFQIYSCLYLNYKKIFNLFFLMRSFKLSMASSSRLGIIVSFINNELDLTNCVYYHHSSILLCQTKEEYLNSVIIPN